MAAQNAREANAADAASSLATNTASNFTANATNQGLINTAQAQNTAAQTNSIAQNNANLQGAKDQNTLKSQQIGLTAAAATVKYETDFKAALANATDANKAGLVALDGQVKSELSKIDNSYKLQLQRSVASGALYQTSMTQISAVMNDKDLDHDAKQEYITHLTDQLQGGLDLQNTITGLVPGGLVDFVDTPPGDGNGPSRGGPAAPAPKVNPIKLAEPAAPAPDDYVDPNNGVFQGG